METFLLILKYIAGPVIGAVIGYLTNWLAVKMLFRPYYPKKIGKLRLPFTPGIIPKRKPALAKAVGDAVGDNLFTSADLSNALNSDAAKAKFGDYAVELWKNAGNKTAKELLVQISADNSTALKDKAENFITDKLYGAVARIDLGGIVATEGAKAINSKKSSLGMLAMFLSDDLVSSLTKKLASGVNGFVEEKGRDLIKRAVNAEFAEILSAPLSNITECIDEQTIRDKATSLYNNLIKDVIGKLTDSIDIAAVVEEKLKAMDVKELEKLVLSVMKKELNSIVNLGALIGFILGIIMIFI